MVFYFYSVYNIEIMKGKKILLGISGSISAYKIAILIRLLVKSGADVKVIMTEEATKFVSPLTISTLSKNQVIINWVNEEHTWNNHVELGLWADIFLIAPATANTIGKMANGICDNMLIATYLSCRCQVLIAPAMDEDMWKHKSTYRNIELLQSYGNKIIEVKEGELASGLIGAGRMAEPEELFTVISESLLSDNSGSKKKLQGKKILISAGPTQEAIDPVRYISNHSSGKMGIALAEECASLGAEVTLVLGPVNEKIFNSSIKIENVISANEMYEAMMRNYSEADIIIMTAAVADYSPQDASEMKIKKQDSTLQLTLKKNTDILEILGNKKSNKQLLVGFALETNNEIENAKTKLQKKNLDYIILNSLKDKNSGFGFETNKVSILNKKGSIKHFPLLTKKEVAKLIIEEIHHA